MLSRRDFLKLGAGVGAGIVLPHGLSANAVRLMAQAPLLDPRTLPQFVNVLPIPGTMPTSGGPNSYQIGAYAISQNLSIGLPDTNVWGYGSSSGTASYPAATIEVTRGTPIDVTWTNNLPNNHPLQVDPTLHWANPDNQNYPPPYGGPFNLTHIPLSPHVHGGEQQPDSDGHPDAWFTPGPLAITGPGWQGNPTFHYHNAQPPTTLWYHDHALGITRLNVYMGLAGFYLVRDPGNEPDLPAGEFEIPLVIQDRLFDIGGQFVYPAIGDNPTIHPFWPPEFFGDTILVNGAVWPFLNVKRGKYRFRILNGSNARFYEMQLQNKTSNAAGPVFTQIGTDGGYLGAPAPMQRLIIGPGERCDVVIDFAAYAPNTIFVLRNFARSPYPKGVTPNPQTDGQIMAFRVIDQPGYTDPLPNVLNPSLTTFPSIGTQLARTRTLTLNEIMGAGGPIEALLNLTQWHEAVSEIIEEGTTEMWEVVNLTGDAHPIHTHLTQFQLVSRQRFNVNNYSKAFDALNPVTVDAAGNVTLPPGGYTEVPVGPYRQGPAFPAPSNERGWKDTIRMMPGEVTTLLVRAGQIEDGSPYPFNPSAAPGYVWHCHVLEHEDNEMMRPYRVNRP